MALSWVFCEENMELSEMELAQPEFTEKKFAQS